MAAKTKSPSKRIKEDSWTPSSGSLEASVWDNLRAMKKENRQLRYKSVEEVMAPLISQVTSLTEYKVEDGKGTGENEALRHLGPSGRWLGRPQKLVQLVGKAVMNLLAVAEDIAEENPNFQTDMVVASEDVRSKGEKVYGAAVEFLADTMSPERRVVMVSAARELLLAVTRLLVIVDMIDVNKILTLSSRIEKKLKLLCSARDESEVIKLARDCSADISLITEVATVCQNSVDSKASLQLLTSVQTDLQRASRMLASASKVFLQCPSEKAAEENREEVLDEMMKSLRALTLLTSGEDPCTTEVGPEVGQLATTFANMETRLSEIVHYKPSKLGAMSLQENLEVVLRGAAELANSASTRDYRQRSILTKSSTLKSELQGLVSILEEDSLEGDQSDEVKDEAKEIASLCRRHLKALQKELQGVCVDHVSDAFIAMWDPVDDLEEVAQKGRRGRVEQCAEALEEHSARILKAGSLSCLLSDDVKHIKEVKSVSNHMSGLTSQVIRAAQTLVAQPSSITLQKNMTIFKDSWTERTTQLMRSIDAMTPLIDFLTITEAHVCGDGVALLQSMSAGEEASFQRSSRLVRERCGRLGHMVRVEMRRNPARYAAEHKKKIKHRMEDLDNNVVAFKEHADKMRFELADSTSNCGLLTYAMEKVVEAVRNLRQEVLDGMSPEDQERSGVTDLVNTLAPLMSLSLSQMSIPGTPEPTIPRKFQRTPCHSDVFETDESSQSAMASLSPEQRTQLAKATAGLSAQQKEFENEVQHWDAENDIVVLAKEMCMMVMNMSDFTRNIGPLKTVMDLVITSKDIARAGEYICSMASNISTQCPDGKSKNDLQAYMDRMKLYCHQLKITSSVRADSKSTVQTVDSASALITAARNALNAAVELVRMSYVASLAISKLRKGTAADQFSMWRLTLPKMKDLEREGTGKDNRDNRDNRDAPIHRLGQFKPGRHRQAPFV